MLYSILPNRRYVDGVSTLQSARKLGVDVARLELREWLLFQSEREHWARGNLNIQLADHETVRVLVFKYSGESEKVSVKPVVSKGYSKLIRELVDRAGT